MRNHYNSATRHVSAMFGVLFNHYGAFTRLSELAHDLKRVDASLYGSSKQFERCLHALVIMIQVIVPHIASEFWSALCTVPALDENLRDRNANVYHQLWPIPDPDADTEFLVKALRISCGRSPVPRAEIEGSNAEEALKLAKEKYHSHFFDLMSKAGHEPIECKVEEHKGLLFILTLKFDKNLKERDLNKIINTATKLKRAKPQRIC